MKTKRKIDDKIALRAFVMPDNYPFLLEAYEDAGKNEADLMADIKKARECYKQLVAAEKKKVQAPAK